MKMFARRIVGAVILTASPIAALVLSLSGVPLMTLEQSHTVTIGSGYATSSVFFIHWPVYLLVLGAVFGFVLLILPRREKTNA